MTTHPTASRRRNRGSEAGYVAIIFALLIPTVFLGLAATALDTARWYLEVERVQKAADAAALAGVPYLPQDLPALTKARARALEVAKRNGYDDASADVAITVQQGNRPSQLRVTISAEVENQFGSMIGVPATTITRTSVADFTGPAPMGSPCNTFGNEPDSGAGGGRYQWVWVGPNWWNFENRWIGNDGEGGASNWQGNTGTATAGADCPRVPQFWGSVEGPESGKVQGDRYQTKNCEASSTDGCGSGGSGGRNEEYREEGYFFVVRVAPEMVNQEVRLQLYDPASVTGGGQQCQDMASVSKFVDDMNPYVRTDGKLRYGRPADRSAGSEARLKAEGFCTGDSFPGSLGGGRQMTTTFALRQQVDSQNPNRAPVQNDTSGAACVRQFTGVNLSGSERGYAQLKEGNNAYNDQLAQVFHNWVPFCSFRPQRSGDYYLQVRTNVAPVSPIANGSRDSIIYRGNATTAVASTGNYSTGAGGNSFSIRAVVAPGFERFVAVSGWGAMPILANAPSASSEFYLLRVLPGAAGQAISFEFFDAADATGAGTVTVLAPSDASGSIGSTPFPGRCKTRKPFANPDWTNAGNERSCSVNVSSANNNGKVQEIQIPIPSDYNCDPTQPTNCWYKVRISFGAGVTVNDFTTWNAEITGDPLRLIE